MKCHLPWSSIGQFEWMRRDAHVSRYDTGTVSMKKALVDYTVAVHVHA